MNPLERREKLREEWKKRKKNPDEIKSVKEFGIEIGTDLSDEEALEGLNSYYEAVNDYWHESKPKKVFSLNPAPFDITEIQYLRGLVMADKIENDYIANPKTVIAQDKTMHDFTEEILSKFDKLEDM